MTDLTIPEFIAKMAAIQAGLHKHTEHALERAARVVEREAKREIGHDEMPAAGPFAAWQPLAERTVREKEDLGYVNRISENDSLLRTGETRDSITHAVEVTGPVSGLALIGSNSDVAVWQERGTARIPPRSFLGGALVRKASQVVKILGSGIHRALLGKGLPGGNLPLP
jgi:hypothetical protein